MSTPVGGPIFEYTDSDNTEFAIEPLDDGGARITVQDSFTVLLCDLTGSQEMEQLAAALDPEAAEAKEAWEKFGEWLEGFKPNANINREQVFGMINQLGVKL